MAASRRKDFPVFDCDSHVVEPPAVWDEYVPQSSRAWIKTQFCFHTDSDLLYINGRVVPAARERSNAAEVGWARWDKKEVGKLTPGTAAWQAKFGRLLGCRDPHARLAAGTYSSQTAGGSTTWLSQSNTGKSLSLLAAMSRPPRFTLR